MANSFGLTMRIAKQTFFDRKIVQAFDAARKRVLSRAGSITRGIARRSLKYRKKNSTHAPPGSPPYVHRKSADFGLKTILFAYDERSDSVIVGPVGSPGRAPEIMEHGGTATIRLTPRQARRRGQRYVKARIKARPFMRPALETFSEDYPDLWKDVIR